MTDYKRELMRDDGENLALRQFINMLSVQTYENLRAGLEGAGFEFCIPDWALTRKGYVTTGDVQLWIRYILAQEPTPPATPAET